MGWIDDIEYLEKEHRKEQKAKKPVKPIPSGACIICKLELKGKRRFYCSTECSSRHFSRKQNEKLRESKKQMLKFIGKN